MIVDAANHLGIAVADRVRMFPIDAVEIKTSALADRGGIIGAVCLAQLPLHP